MPGDEPHEESAVAGARGGPRHAAPKKPLLTRLHLPAGKAIAIAAMPSAVLMGMGLTPQLAMAKPKPENPFRDGPCVTAPDRAEEREKKEAEAKKKAEEKAEADKKAEEAAEAAKAAEAAEAAEAAKGAEADEGSDGAGEPDATATPSGGEAARSGERPSGAPDAPGGGEDASGTPASPSPSESENPWYDPLGVGRKIKGAFTPDGEKSDEERADATKAEEGKAEEGKAEEGKAEAARMPAPPSPPSAGSAPSAKDKGDAVEETADRAGAAKDAAPAEAKKAAQEAEKAAKAAKEAAAEADAAESAAEEAGGTPPPPSGSQGARDAQGADADGKKPFPCVVEKKSAGTDERPPAQIPDQPWFLEASSLTLRGADYQGIVNLTTAGGRTKQAMKYVISDGTDIGDLHQTVDGPAGKTYHIQAAEGSTSTIRGGETTMLTERLQGKLFGLIPVTFDAEHPPPLNIPLIYLTDVHVKQAAQFGGDLKVPGLRSYITD